MIEAAQRVIEKTREWVMAEKLTRKWNACTKEEFDVFIKDYPRPLVRDLLTIATPDRIQFNDFSLGKWPDSVIAFYDAWGHTPGDIWGPEPGGYRIRGDML